MSEVLVDAGVRAHDAGQMAPRPAIKALVIEPWPPHAYRHVNHERIAADSRGGSFGKLEDPSTSVCVCHETAPAGIGRRGGRRRGRQHPLGIEDGLHPSGIDARSIGGASHRSIPDAVTLVRISFFATRVPVQPNTKRPPLVNQLRETSSFEPSNTRTSKCRWAPLL